MAWILKGQQKYCVRIKTNLQAVTDLKLPSYSPTRLLRLIPVHCTNVCDNYYQHMHLYIVPLMAFPNSEWYIPLLQ